MLLAAVVAVIGLVAWFLFSPGHEAEPPLPEPAPVASAPPPIRHPAPSPVPSRQPDSVPEEVPPPEPLPALGPASDPVMRELASELIGEEAVQTVGLGNDLVRRIVVTIDNLPRDRVPVRLRPVAPAPGQFEVAGTEDEPVIGPGNAGRYEALTRIFVAMPTEQLVQTYGRLYPLFQQAYVELGYPEGYFNDRLVEVIDHLLAAPRVDGQIELVRPHVMFRFADPELEALSPGHKLMVRIGPENARALKAKLREVRAMLTASVAAPD